MQQNKPERITELAQLLNSEDLTHTKLADDSGVILDVETQQVFSLNESAMFLVEAVHQGATSNAELVRALVAEFEVDEASARSDVEAFVETLARYMVDHNRRTRREH